MYDQLYDVFKSKFSLNMSGFLRGDSCCTALLKMVDDWRQFSETQGQLVGPGKRPNGREKNLGKEKSRRRRRAPGDKVLTDH